MQSTSLINATSVSLALGSAFGSIIRVMAAIFGVQILVASARLPSLTSKRATSTLLFLKYNKAIIVSISNELGVRPNASAVLITSLA